MEVFIPNSVEELLTHIDNDRRRLASGCTDIIASQRVGKLIPKPIIDINSIEEIKKIYEAGNKVYIGANVPISDLLESDIVNKNFKLLSKAAGTIGSPQIRNRATLGGNIANASPSGDSILALTLLDAELILKSLSGERTVRIKDFIKGVGSTELHRDEFIEYIVLEKKFEGWKSYFEKVGLRNAVVISVCSMGIIYKMNGNIIADIRIAYGAVAPKVMEISEAENLMKGKSISREILGKTREIIESTVTPIDDVRATAEYRRVVSGKLIMRLLENI